MNKNIVSSKINTFEVGIKVKFYNHALRKARTDMGFKTVRSFCDAYNLCYTTYLSFETMNRYPPLHTAFKLSEIFSIPPEELFPDFLKRVGKNKMKEIYLKRDFIYQESSNINIPDLRRGLLKVIDSLDDREKKVLLLRWGIESGTPITLNEAAIILNVSPERIRQIESKAIRKLRHPARKEGLKDFIDC